MADKEAAIQYMNLLARGLQVVNSYPRTYASIEAMVDYPVIADGIKVKMDQYWEEGKTCFFEKTRNLMDDIMHMENESRYAMALAYCIWMDLRLTYSLNEQNGRGERTHFSLYALIPAQRDDFLVIYSLNDNYRDTGIWINPKFATSVPMISYGEEDKRERNMANRDVFQGINGTLVNCSYVLWEEGHTIENIILPNDFQNQGNNVWRVAFAPMSDNDSHLETNKKVIERDGFSYEGIEIVRINDGDLLYERFKRDWKLAGENKADIFFAPEMLGTALTEQEEEEEYNQLIYQLSKERMEKGQAVPWLTIMPTYWHEGKNRLTIVFQDGRVISHHFKHVAFIEKKKNRMEALSELGEFSTTVVHIPKKHRLSFLICAEFLGKDKYHSRDYLCGSLGTTLLIVPSYSGGEQDFINLLKSMDCYGATVIWGNCCGAIAGKEKGIGGCGMAGGGRSVFGEVCKCGNKCTDIEACVFQVDVPLDFKIKKTMQTDFSDKIEHKILWDAGQCGKEGSEDNVI